jgi:enoyl-CoA hydratase/carnithine racemase
MSEGIQRRDETLGNFVAGPQLKEYAPRFAGHFALTRDQGILTVRMHTDGGPAMWSRGLLNAWNLLLRDIAADRANEVVLITGTGDRWIGGVDPASFAEPLSSWASDLLDEQFNDGIKLLERLVFDTDVPTIAAINGPGPRLEIALMCDITLCTPQTAFADGNFSAGSVPGDGMHLVLSELAGPKRAAYLAYTGTGLSAGQALELGLVNEICPAEHLPERAQEIARAIMARPRTARRLTHSLVSRSWQHRIVADLRSAYAHQLLSMTRRP